MGVVGTDYKTLQMPGFRACLVGMTALASGIHCRNHIVIGHAGPQSGVCVCRVCHTGSDSLVRPATGCAALDVVTLRPSRGSPCECDLPLPAAAVRQVGAAGGGLIGQVSLTGLIQSHGLRKLGSCSM